ncbi:MAG TPA: DUF2085 domain-containing protein [Vicinamibacterales bacterium]|nr:DUF2085 domain-containing protein [Vicinamibacterales bacterium]
MRLARGLVLALVLWVVALVWAPSAIASSNPALATMATMVYQGGAVVCHQRPERSFVLFGRPMPVCARCTGLYASALAGAALALAVAMPMGAGRARWVLAIAVAPTIATVMLERAGLAAPSNLVRAVAAIPAGVAAAWLVIGLLRDSR